LIFFDLILRASVSKDEIAGARGQRGLGMKIEKRLDDLCVILARGRPSPSKPGCPLMGLDIQVKAAADETP
jgi:hypothetical protein